MRRWRVRIFPRMGDRGHDQLAVAALRHARPELLQQGRLVRHEPALDHLPVRDAQDGDFVDVDLLPCGRYAEKIAAVRPREPEQHADLVAFRDDFLDHVHAVGERAAQERAGPREALALGVRRQVVQAAAQTLVAGRQHFLHRGFFFRRALRFLEAQRHRLVALE